EAETKSGSSRNEVRLLTSAATNREANIEAFCSEFVTTAFRRPLKENQKHLFVSAHFKKAVKVEDAVKRVVLLTLKSPRFLYLGFTPEIIADLRTSLDVFLEDAVWTGSSDYRQLLLADYLYVNDRLAKFYGVETNTADDFVKVEFDPNQRSGVVTHPYLLAAFSYQKSTSPIHRGVF